MYQESKNGGKKMYKMNEIKFKVDKGKKLKKNKKLKE